MLGLVGSRRPVKRNHHNLSISKKTKVKVNVLKTGEGFDDYLKFLSKMLNELREKRRSKMKKTLHFMRPSMTTISNDIS